VVIFSKFAFIYINCPPPLAIGGVSFIVMFIFLHVNYKDETSFANKLKRIDILGDTILMTVPLLFYTL
jgi:hypothetical protein